MKNNIDKANDILYKTLLSLVELNKQDLKFKEKEMVNDIIDNLENARHLLYEYKNETNKDFS
ncbi:MAG: hypothetical protein ACLSWB_05810 [Clostridia bacterium]